MKTSEVIKNISKALVDFQAEVTNPKQTANNPFYKSKYTPLQDIINHVRPVLAKHKLAVMQNAQSEEGESITVTTRLIHESGEWIEGDPLTMKAEKLTPQGAGSAITYARRYAISAILGIASEDDDDGNVLESAKPAQTRRPATRTTSTKPKADATISTAQARKLFAVASEEQVRQVLAEYGVESTKNIKAADYNDILFKLEVLAAELIE